MVSQLQTGGSVGFDVEAGTHEVQVLAAIMWSTVHWLFRVWGKWDVCGDIAEFRPHACGRITLSNITIGRQLRAAVLKNIGLFDIVWLNWVPLRCALWIAPGHLSMLWIEKRVKVTAAAVTMSLSAISCRRCVHCLLISTIFLKLAKPIIECTFFIN